MQYLTLLTQLGANKIATATANNSTIKLTQIAIGDGSGTVPMPNANQTALVNEVFRADLNNLKVDENNANWVVAVGYIPSTEGDFWVREVGIYDVDGDLIAIGNYPETFKPVMANNVAKDIYVKMIFEVSSTDAVTLQIDPSIVMASREYVGEELSKKVSITDLKSINGATLLGGGNLVIEGVPSGIITMWSGLISEIPNGWYLCNGANGTPDLRGRFVYGASVDGDINAKGGSADAIVVEHTHTANHNHSASSNTTGNHSHTVYGHYDGASVSTISSFGGGSSFNRSNSTSSNGNHSHTITVNTANVTTSSTGESGTGKNLPPFMKLAYLMKG